MKISIDAIQPDLRNLVLIAALTLFALHTTLAQKSISIDANRPGYWSYGSETTLLLGGSVEDNLFQIANLEEHLDLLKSVGGNYVRNTMSSRDSTNLWPFYFDQNKGLYDLTRWNNEYWNRFEKFLQLTAARDIIVQIEIWATFDFYRDNWDKNPFNPKNNITYPQERVKLPLEVKTHPTRTENPFFWSVPLQHNNIKLLESQQAFVDKLLSYSLNYGNVLYCIDNETSVTASWGRFWADYIRKKCKELGKKVYITEMWDPWNLGHITHRETFDHPEIYDFVEISQNNHQRGQNHWDNGLTQIERLKLLNNLRPVTNIKTYGNDLGSHGGGTQNGIQSFIRSVFFGSAAVRFHRPTSGLGLGEEAQAVIKSIRELTERMDFFNTVPANHLLSDCEENEAYCRAKAGEEYAIYFTNGGSVNIDLTAFPGPFEIQWLDVIKNKWSTKKEIKGGKAQTMNSPAKGHWIALVQFIN
ncbi:MAG: hypothetical protein JXQ96_16045 [Cyclobacteriaceae bacterium]